MNLGLAIGHNEGKAPDSGLPLLIGDWVQVWAGSEATAEPIKPMNWSTLGDGASPKSHIAVLQNG